ncbi:MAG: sensor histidine kinase [Phycisphaerales bacterium]
MSATPDNNSDFIASLDPSELLARIDGLERSLHSLQDEADRTSQLATMGLAAATLAHELGNLLTPVLSYAQLAQQRPNDAAFTQRAFERVVSGLKSATELIEHTLDFAQPQRGSHQHNETSLATAIDATLRLIDLEAAQQGVLIQVDVAVAHRARIAALPMQQVIMNLLLNAMHALREHGPCDGRRPTIRFECTRSRDGRELELSISDNGPGIPKSVAATLFQPFTDVENDLPDATTSNAAGDKPRHHGLGLAICRNLVETAGGNINVRSSPETGTTFKILLPAAPVSLKRAG